MEILDVAGGQGISVHAIFAPAAPAAPAAAALLLTSKACHAASYAAKVE
jgi:hypothetical protein